MYLKGDEDERKGDGGVEAREVGAAEVDVGREGFCFMYMLVSALKIS
jgi:hypothetical protein